MGIAPRIVRQSLGSRRHGWRWCWRASGSTGPHAGPINTASVNGVSSAAQHRVNRFSPPGSFGPSNGFGIEEWRPTDIVITDRDQIDRFIDFVGTKNDNWRKPGGTYPSSQYTAAVQRKKETVLLLSLSPTWIGSDNRTRSVSAEEWAELVRLLLAFPIREKAAPVSMCNFKKFPNRTCCT